MYLLRLLSLIPEMFSSAPKTCYENGKKLKQVLLTETYWRSTQPCSCLPQCQKHTWSGWPTIDVSSPLYSHKVVLGPPCQLRERSSNRVCLTVPLSNFKPGLWSLWSPPFYVCCKPHERVTHEVDFYFTIGFSYKLIIGSSKLWESYTKVTSQQGFRQPRSAITSWVQPGFPGYTRDGHLREDTASKATPRNLVCKCYQRSTEVGKYKTTTGVYWENP